MLDDENVIKQRDPSGALVIASEQYAQAAFAAVVQNPEHDERRIDQVVVAGMGGSALAAELAKAWLALELTVPFEIVRNYDLPQSVGNHTLVIASSYSGNTEEVLSCLKQAQQFGAQIAVTASGGQLIEHAQIGGCTDGPGIGRKSK